MNATAIRDRTTLANRLRESAKDLEKAILDRLIAVELGGRTQDAAGFLDLAKLIEPLVAYGISATELGERRCPPPPPEALAHARKAAWQGVPPRIIQERYIAAYTVFSRFLRGQARELGRSMSLSLFDVQESNDIIFERLIQAIGEEYERESQRRSRSRSQKLLQRVQDLLAGKLVDAPDLDYDLAASHIGFAGTGGDAESALSRLRISLGGQWLFVHPSPQHVWAWCGLQRSPSSSELRTLLEIDAPIHGRISTGTPEAGLLGWRRTHRQAAAGLTVAERQGKSLVQYADVALLASTINDYLLSDSLIRMYLEPLKQTRGHGAVVLETLRAYFSTEQHVSSAAALLGVKRHTVTSRLRIAEEQIGRPIGACASELALALQIAELGLDE